MTGLILPSGGVLDGARFDHARVVVETALRNVPGQWGERAAMACIACCLVESNLVIFANSNVPTSMLLAHESVGYDHASVGLFQQQVPSWGTAADCMDPAKSTLKFLQGAGTNPGLLNLPRYRFDYVGQSDKQNWFAMPIGNAVQAVQVSAFPTRYQQRVDDARAIVTHFKEDDDMTPAQVQEIVNQSLRDFAFGTNGPRHKTNPLIAPDPSSGVYDRLARITSGLSAVAKQAKSQGIDIGGLDKDVDTLQAQIKQIKASQQTK